MILTCPTCASQYSVDDSKLAGRSRTVRCVNCKATWTATAPAAEAPAAAPQAAPESRTAPAPEPAAAPSAGSVKDDAVPEMPLPQAYRAKVEAKKRTRAAVAAGMVWGGLAAALLAVIALAVLFRVEVVRLWPRTAGAYAKAGMPVNPLGLTPENVEAGTGLVNGRAAVVVTGKLRNIQGRAQPAQPLRVALVDKAGKRLAVQVAAPAPGVIPPGEARAFRVQFLDPPTASQDVEVEFAFDLMSAAHRPAAKPVPTHEPVKHGEPAAHGPEAQPPETHAVEPHAAAPLPKPQEAKALPSGSPYALPKAAAENNPAHKPVDG